MLISYSWLSTHLDLSGFTTEKLSDLLTFAGVEVEGITESGISSPLVVVAQVLSAEQHPDADRLKVCQVDAGEAGKHQIVCGATNYKVGDKVPLALPGAVLPGGFEIKAGKLRGVESGGMMCSGRELGLSEDQSGLMILPQDSDVGVPLKSLVPSDTLIEVEVTPNRPDLLSHFGLARELAALTGESLQTQQLETADEKSAGKLVTLQWPEVCPYYTARMIRGVKVGESPAWLKDRLKAIGLRPINNIVDITNFVLHDVGYPLHAFDFDNLEGGCIVVRQAEAGEKFVALNDATYELDNQDLVIADAKKAVAIAGVMGGQESGVSESTVNILLESAWFEPSHIRRTAKKLMLSSDSSYRFERGADPQMAALASAMAVKLILELAGGVADDVLLMAGEAPVRTGEVKLDWEKAREFLGGHVSREEQDGILTKLGLEKVADDAWHIPSYRADLQRPIDLVEEIARVHGLAEVPGRTMAAPAATSVQDRIYDFVSGLKSTLASLGMFEARTLKLISRAQLADVPDASAKVVPLKNPLSEDHTMMRPSVIPGLLEVGALNRSQGAGRIAFFESGTVFSAEGNDGDVFERQSIGLILGGEAGESSWAEATPRTSGLEDLRAIVERLLPIGQKVKVQAVDRPGCVMAAELSITKKEVIGMIGQIEPSRARAMDCLFPVYIAELDIARLFALAESKVARFEELPKFPASTRDIALDVPVEFPSSRIDSALGNIAVPMLESWRVFDVFRDPSGDKLAADRKSLAWSLTYRDKTRTLRSEEVDAAHAKVRETLAKLQGVKLR